VLCLDFCVCVISVLFVCFVCERLWVWMCVFGCILFVFLYVLVCVFNVLFVPVCVSDLVWCLCVCVCVCV